MSGNMTLEYFNDVQIFDIQFLVNKDLDPSDQISFNVVKTLNKLNFKLNNIDLALDVRHLAN
jgi:hypothetical protein